MALPTAAQVKAWIENKVATDFTSVEGVMALHVKEYIADLEAKLVKLAAKLTEHL